MLAAVRALVLRFGARKVDGLRLAELSQEMAKRDFDVDYDGFEAVAELPLVAGRNNSLSQVA